MSEGIPHGVFAWMAAHHDLRLHGAISAESVWELAGPSSNCSIVPGAPKKLDIRWPKRIHCNIHNQVVVSNMFYFHPYLGKIPILTNIFQRG